MNDILLPLNQFNYNTELTNTLKCITNSNKKDNTLKIAKEVEGVFIHILIKSMKNTIPHNNLLDNSQSDLYMDIYNQKISEDIASKGMGLTNIIFQNINQQQEKYMVK